MSFLSLSGRGFVKDAWSILSGWPSVLCTQWLGDAALRGSWECQWIGLQNDKLKPCSKVSSRAWTLAN